MVITSRSKLILEYYKSLKINLKIKGFKIKKNIEGIQTMRVFHNLDLWNITFTVSYYGSNSLGYVTDINFGIRINIVEKILSEYASFFYGNFFYEDSVTFSEILPAKLSIKLSNNLEKSSILLSETISKEIVPFFEKYHCIETIDSIVNKDFENKFIVIV